MKKYLGFAIVTISLSLVSFTPHYSIDDVVAAIRGGNASQLSKYFDSRVDISYQVRAIITVKARPK